MAYQARCIKCRIRIDYRNGEGNRFTKASEMPLRRLACPWCQGPVQCTSSNLKIFPTIKRDANGVWPIRKGVNNAN